MASQDSENFVNKIWWVVGGILVGTIITGTLQFAYSWYDRYQQKKSLKSAFSGEISALLGINDQLEISKYAKECKLKIQKSGNTNLFYFPVKNNYFNVYTNYISKIGMLESDNSKDICTFYTYALSATEYLNELSENKKTRRNVKQLCEDIDDLIALLSKLDKIGKAIIKHLDES
ncbi:MAG: hypothetical protein FD174_623 [Geobacteraceae bacterium]|nr:MAG: hypothetical protein FD174_623 [Geobacteraceae bacterium]